MKIKLYRFTVRQTEPVPSSLGGKPIVFYFQTSWGDCPNYAPTSNRELVLVEEKEVEVSDECLKKKD